MGCLGNTDDKTEENWRPLWTLEKQLFKDPMTDVSENSTLINCWGWEVMILFVWRKGNSFRHEAHIHLLLCVLPDALNCLQSIWRWLRTEEGSSRKSFLMTETVWMFSVMTRETYELWNNILEICFHHYTTLLVFNSQAETLFVVTILNTNRCTVSGSSVCSHTLIALNISISRVFSLNIFKHFRSADPLQGYKMFRDPPHKTCAVFKNNLLTF